MSKLDDLAIISKHIGTNLDLVQGAGGNTSVKQDDVLWIKASGCWLKDAGSRDIFVPADYPGIVKDLARNDDESVTPKVLQLGEGTSLRPSIETSLHALMPHRYVVHVHSVNAIANAVLDDGKKRMARLLDGVSWSWVPYVRPGIPLTRAVQRVMHLGLNVLILANHGLVLGADSKEEIFDLLDDLESRLSCPRREPIVADGKKILSLVANTDYQPSKYPLVQLLAFDPVALSIATTNPLYPDHIVFLGTGSMLVMESEDVRVYLEKEKCSSAHEVIIVRGVGVIKHSSLSESAEEMLHCLANVLLRIQAGAKLRYLTEHEQAEIAGWDAEKYRQLNQN